MEPDVDRVELPALLAPSEPDTQLTPQGPATVQVSYARLVVLPQGLAGVPRRLRPLTVDLLVDLVLPKGTGNRRIGTMVLDPGGQSIQATIQYVNRKTTVWFNTSAVTEILGSESRRARAQSALESLVGPVVEHLERIQEWRRTSDPDLPEVDWQASDPPRFSVGAARRYRIAGAAPLRDVNHPWSEFLPAWCEAKTVMVMAPGVEAAPRTGTGIRCGMRWPDGTESRSAVWNLGELAIWKATRHRPEAVPEWATAAVQDTTAAADWVRRRVVELHR
ncbi:hypothetical protein [Citricoccus sp. I39-566]|uniref:hypothetical protein n=1 Tax=Citricoccus sp. I39-566 TaxID=3073268 RepID=UPI00286C28F6|nr:hypothetical protein [Citricoccus sp. I39-566]WMY79484.1 hypothetical protein RE421_06405 [Citricoccus sp. I39-566]